MFRYEQPIARDASSHADRVISEETLLSRLSKKVKHGNVEVEMRIIQLPASLARVKLRRVFPQSFRLNQKKLFENENSNTFMESREHGFYPFAFEFRCVTEIFPLFFFND